MKTQISLSIHLVRSYLCHWGIVAEETPSLLVEMKNPDQIAIAQSGESLCWWHMPFLEFVVKLLNFLRIVEMFH